MQKNLSVPKDQPILNPLHPIQQSAQNSHSQMQIPHSNSFHSPRDNPPHAMNSSGLNTPTQQQTSLPSQPLQESLQNPTDSGGSGVYRPLNVKDALSYLDQVKMQFQSQPDVYNKFLDIMKDFKSQSIDTPGVINRVSRLFRGHPALIYGFNTFLPPGYRIEITGDPSDPVKITTPSGISSGLGGENSHPGGGPPNDSSGYYQSQQGRPSPQQPSVPLAPSHIPPSQPPPTYSTPIPSLPPLQNAAQAMSAGGPLNLQHLDASLSLEQQSSTQSSSKDLLSKPQLVKGPVEFNHAINYVNKIKDRYASEPLIYKQFLAILQTYQKEAEPIQDVYGQVRALFKDAPDLLEEFKQFLPDSGGGFVFNQSSQSGSRIMTPGGQGINRLPPVGNFAPPDYSGYRKHSLSSQSGMHSVGSNQATPSNTVGLMASAAARDAAQSGFSGKKKRGLSSKDVPGSGIVAKKKSKSFHMSNIEFEGSSVTPPNSITPSELEFFDHVKKSISSKAVYTEFLKVLNLFSQEILDKRTLMERIEGFLGKNTDLLEWFQNFVKFDESDAHYENVPVQREPVDISKCKSFGPSYRALPKSLGKPLFSGRDKLGYEVINDTFVSHPTWASEESGFIAHRKNIYEEHLHRVEEDRYEIDRNLEANSRVISLLEPIAQKIQAMANQEEREEMKLKDCFGETELAGLKGSICVGVIKKIYDRERGLEVLDALQKNPTITVPIVLKRLKQKDIEWKKIRAAQNKIWRDSDLKNFAKSLDHQGINFKSNDRKAIAPKTLCSEIEALKREQFEKFLTNSSPLRYQYEFHFQDKEILRDTLYLIILCGLTSGSNNNGNGSYGVNVEGESEEELFDMFLQGFIKEFFSISRESVAKIIKLAKQKHFSKRRADEEIELDENETGLEESLKMEEKVHDDTFPDSCIELREVDLELEDTREGEQRDVDMKDEFAENVQSIKNEELDTPCITTNVPASKPTRRDSWSLYSNSGFYVFFRLFEIVYNRLQTMRNSAVDVYKLKKRFKVNPVAVQLGIRESIIEDDIEPEDMYAKLLDLIEKVFEGDMESQIFEEEVRSMYGIQAYIIFTIHKVLQALFKQIQTITSDPKYFDNMKLFLRAKRSENGSVRHQTLYRVTIENGLPSEESLYRIDFYPSASTMTIQLLNKEDLGADNLVSTEEKWSYYIDNYIQIATTEPSVGQVAGAVCLKRNIPSDVSDHPPTDVYTSSGLEVKICVNTYKIFFVHNTEDIFWRLKPSILPAVKEKKIARMKNLKHQALVRWLSSISHSKSPVPISNTSATDATIMPPCPSNVISDNQTTLPQSNSPMLQLKVKEENTSGPN